ncbi:MAG: hypothetical protein B5M54_02825 [Candidatus Aminicenantes bacterium 4484_214]|nr:MAG: hypothetical protein B5M54_02825 [Candidatus Aminicenantes bacterium 4484_214]RLE09672.1 MAG: hypothetical protein DRJ06_02445 [Candidatus Aminicenantes bacterium]
MEVRQDFDPPKKAEKTRRRPGYYLYFFSLNLYFLELGQMKFLLELVHSLISLKLFNLIKI